jgi:hypothetical protein
MIRKSGHRFSLATKRVAFARTSCANKKSRKAWQDDPDKPIASAFGHFMLRPAPGADEE